jgi:hypothetical protein
MGSVVSDQNRGARLGNRPTAMVNRTGKRWRGTVRHRVEEEASNEGDTIWGRGGGEVSARQALHCGAAQPTVNDGGRPKERRRTSVQLSVSTTELRRSSRMRRRHRMVVGGCWRWRGAMRCTA